MNWKKNNKVFGRFARVGILTLFSLCLLKAGPVWALDPEIEELERQTRELEAKQREKAERQAEEARRKAERAAKEKAAAEQRRKRQAAAREEERRRAAEAAARREREARAARDLAGEFVRIEPGCFEMGSPEWEEGRDNDEKRHRVCITQAFELGKTEVTQAQWERVMGENPSWYSNCGSDCPVEQVSWNDVQDFISKLNSRTGRRYRLPTEAEWEYACRSGGENEKYCGGGDVDRLGWYGDNSGSRTHPVGQKRANGLGLYDMSGNVWEWVQDWYDSDYYERSPLNDPEGPSGGSMRVSRGGGWGSLAGYQRSAGRVGYSPELRYYDLGFRLARTR